VHLYTIGGDLIANAYLFVHIVINSKSLAVVCFLFFFLSRIICLNIKQKPRRSLSRYRRSLLRRKLRVAAFRPVNHRQIDDLFKVIHEIERSVHFLFLFKCFLVGYSTIGNRI
jgi:hypothetical protein